ncbi:hypothetical protein B840_06465 [Corynebacterium marinum DSM 44953]|uniref:Cardiolipin synthase N-terminal domain-containing protein n=2 Tax=Corynebacterium marinum TaxID=349751 RepID=A0A0B6TLU9_9CORY|nr:hypothetical protein B840_06465 [Corynebacterium marinum DSM 44953]GGO19707.1 hypothetical protein GCM10010980_19210 [Corynebacterium marinum]
MAFMKSANPSITRTRQKFTDLPLPAKVGVVAGVAAEVSAKIAAWVDLYRRPADKVRGPKWAWAVAQLINGVGPAAYWSFGRK